jgi:hypothetical protein
MADVTLKRTVVAFERNDFAIEWTDVALKNDRLLPTFRSVVTPSDCGSSSPERVDMLLFLQYSLFACRHIAESRNIIAMRDVERVSPVLVRTAGRICIGLFAWDFR